LSFSFLKGTSYCGGDFILFLSPCILFWEKFGPFYGKKHFGEISKKKMFKSLNSLSLSLSISKNKIKIKIKIKIIK
jgi:hypothetical protein